MRNSSLIVIFSLLLLSKAYAEDPNLTLTSSAFENEQLIPAEYTCRGENVNPPLDIQNSPLGTKSFVLIVHDPDAAGGDWIHWAVYDIDPSTKTIAKASVAGKELINNFNQYHYGGPCPPNGLVHHYDFDLYALNTKFSFNENGSPQGLLQMIQGHILGKAQLIGTFKNFSK